MKLSERLADGSFLGCCHDSYEQAARGLEAEIELLNVAEKMRQDAVRRLEMCGERVARLEAERDRLHEALRRTCDELSAWHVMIQGTGPVIRRISNVEKTLLAECRAALKPGESE
jgi:hypothetical protein